MNRAIRQYRPSSSWMTAGLLTLFVISFGIFAETHRPGHESELITFNVVEKSFHATSSSQAAHTTSARKTLFRYH